MSELLRVQDIHGLPLSTNSSKAGDAFDNTVMGYVKYRLDTPAFLKETLRSDPEFGLATATEGPGRPWKAPEGPGRPAPQDCTKRKLRLLLLRSIDIGSIKAHGS